MLWNLGARCVVVALGPLVLLGCGTPRYASNWGELEAGMTRSEVLDLLGAPTTRTHIERPGGMIVRERWQYGETSTSTATPTALGIASPEDVFVVSFGADGRVSHYRRPLVGRDAEPQPPPPPSGEPPG